MSKTLKINFKLIIYIVIALVIVALIVLTIFPGIIQAWKDSGKSTNEKCQTPPSYTKESWREHMGHHPDIYKECLV
ncbi:hypothetical protein J4205_03555 [Candidatus Pacearchaeota archaeon]|nr:hypothetical protein [Candidatus Pacearchaeota archaeon]